MKYSILIPYVSRLGQLAKTIESMKRLYEGRDDTEIVIVVDKKSKEEWESVVDIVANGPFVSKHIVADYDTNVPSPHYNIASEYAEGRYLIFTSPECRHDVDILAGLDEEFDKNHDAYVICACRSENEDGSFDRWYQHSKEWDKRYHFCTAISSENYQKAGGFDEDYRYGICYDDNDFLMRVRRLGLQEVTRDDLVATHQWHKHTRVGDGRKLEDINKKLYYQKWPNVL